MNTSVFWEWLRGFLFGIEIRRLTPPQPYIEYQRRSRIAVYFWAAAILLATIFSPLPHTISLAGICVVAAAGLGMCLWIAASVRYVLAWDELQRRALAESGAITALVLIGILTFDSLLERLFRLPHISAWIWSITGIAIWYIALPLIRRYYEA